MSERTGKEYYLGLPYKLEIVPDEDGVGFHAAIPDLRGCAAYGETIEEAVGALASVKEAWIEVALDRQWRIPEPTVTEERWYSGRFNVRLPRSLHRDLARWAEAEGTSLNQLVVEMIARGVERLEAEARAGALGELQLPDLVFTLETSQEPEDSGGGEFDIALHPPTRDAWMSADSSAVAVVA